MADRPQRRRLRLFCTVDSAALDMRAREKMLGAARMLEMAELRQPWPRPHLDASPPLGLARPRAHLEGLPAHMTFVDRLGPVSELPSPPFVGVPPQSDGASRRP